MSYHELAQKTGITANAVRKRIGKLEDSGVIDYYTIELTYTMIDAHSLLAWILTDGTRDEEEFSNALGSSEYILDVTPHAGGYYAVFADYITAEDMSRITRLIRAQKGVLNVEIHPLILYTSLAPPMSDSELKKLHFRILKPLINDPKMPINEIALAANLSSRTVRRALKEIMEHGGVRFTLKWNPEVSTGTHFSALIKYDQSKSEHSRCTNWLMETFPVELWEVFESTIEPMILAYFVVPAMGEVESITRAIRQADFVTAVVSHVATKTRSYDGLRRRILLELIESSCL